MNGRPGGQHKGSWIALGRRSSFLTSDDRVAQQIEGAQPRPCRTRRHGVAVEHHPEIARMGDRKAHIGAPERLETGAGVGRRRVAFGDQKRLECFESLLGDPPQELLAAGKVMIGRPCGDPDASRQLAQVQGVDPAFGDHLDRSLDQRAPEASVVVVGLGFSSHHGFWLGAGRAQARMSETNAGRVRAI